uniref:ORF 2 n=1 Tax=Mus musculus TaxID=10090 RepID=Q62295_MOUSE|nr:ORF 2 [Mus musculus]
MTHWSAPSVTLVPHPSAPRPPIPGLRVSEGAICTSRQRQASSISREGGRVRETGIVLPLCVYTHMCVCMHVCSCMCVYVCVCVCRLRSGLSYLLSKKGKGWGESRGRWWPHEEFEQGWSFRVLCLPCSCYGSSNGHFLGVGASGTHFILRCPFCTLASSYIQIWLPHSKEIRDPFFSIPQNQGQTYQGCEMKVWLPGNPSDHRLSLFHILGPTEFSVQLLVGEEKWPGFRVRWRAASRLACRTWPMRYSLSWDTSDSRRSNSRMVLLSDMPSRSCFPPSCPMWLQDRLRLTSVVLTVSIWERSVAVGSDSLLPPRCSTERHLLVSRAWAIAWPPSSSIQLRRRLRKTRLVLCASA